jgi:hypothetical protein
LHQPDIRQQHLQLTALIRPISAHLVCDGVLQSLRPLALYLATALALLQFGGGTPARRNTRLIRLGIGAWTQARPAAELLRCVEAEYDLLDFRLADGVGKTILLGGT